MPNGTGGPGAPRRELVRWSAACGLFGALATALFSPALLAGRTLAPGDATLYYYPHFVARPGLWTTAPPPGPRRGIDIRPLPGPSPRM